MDPGSLQMQAQPTLTAEASQLARLQTGLPALPQAPQVQLQSPQLGPPPMTGEVMQLQYPPRLTSGIPDPGAISKQREAYLRALEDQEKQAIALLEQQRAHQVGLLRAQGKQQKEKYGLEVDQQASQNEMVLTKQHSEQTMELHKLYSSQRGLLESQANRLIMEWQQKKATEEMRMQQYRLQVDQHNALQRYNEEMLRIKGQQDQTMKALENASNESYMPPYQRQVSVLPPALNAQVEQSQRTLHQKELQDAAERGLIMSTGQVPSSPVPLPAPSGILA